MCQDCMCQAEGQHKVYGTRTINKSPVEQWIIYKGLEYSHDTVLVLPQHSHHTLTRPSEITLNASDL